MKYPMTIHGAQALREELQRLKSERPRVAADIAEARAHGDLKENAEYDAARHEQGLMEARIKDIEAKLSQAQIVDISRLPNKGKVVFGCTVTVCQVAQGNEITYQIVGEDEADLKINKISFNSPIARALIGKEIDESVSVNTPGGFVEYEIIDVQYA